MPEEENDVWADILREALTASDSGKPIAGAHFRQTVATAASKRGVMFPPPQKPELKFIQLIERYPKMFAVLRRPGQDFLLAAADKSELLKAGIEERLYGIRSDFFGAFTLVLPEVPYYDKSLDRVTWRAQHDNATLGPSLVRIEPATEASEVQMRRDFINSLPQSPVRDSLTESLTRDRPLQAFSRAMKEAGLPRKWHSFRTERLLKKLQEWARENQIEWRNAWLTDKPDYTSRIPSRQPAMKTEHHDNGLEVLLPGLDFADIQRISIPLDLVLKVISASKNR